jgi:hypothetical protein
MLAELELPLEHLLSKSGINAEIIACTPITRGGNNRIFRLTTTVGALVAKYYFRHSSDQRDRLASEYAFLHYAAQAAPAYVPRPFGCDREEGLALFEFIEGTPIDNVGDDEVRQAIRFFCALNRVEFKTPACPSLPMASEACFSLAKHWSLIESRLQRLLTETAPENAIDQAALAFLKELYAFWQSLKVRVKNLAEAQGQWLRPLKPEHRCISPSDFGFHNALKTAEGSLRFIDFEYAGLDDPAKMVGDFFAQLAVPVPAEFFEKFVRQCLQDFPEADLLIARARWLRPVYKIKWCCIALNVFLPEALARRKFANPELDEATVKQTQLAKAEQIFITLKQDAFDGLY